MGTYIGHVLPGVGFILIGLWHLFNTIGNYVEAPWNFEARPWFPTRWRRWYLRYLELLAIMIGACSSIAAELFICPSKHQPFADDWTIPIDHLSNFEHSTISLFFLFYGATCLVTDVLQINLPRGMLNVMGAFAFSQELLLFHFHSADHMGLEGHYHWLLQLPIAVGLLAALLEVAVPKAFILSYLRSLSILFQGVWFVQMGVNLYDLYWLPNGCVATEDSGHWEVICRGEPGVRANALANLYFSLYLIAVLLFSFVLYVSMNYYQSRQHYEPLRISSLKAHDGRQNTKDLESGTSPGSDDGSVESEIDMQAMSTISLQR